MPFGKVQCFEHGWLRLRELAKLRVPDAHVECCHPQLSFIGRQAPADCEFLLGNRHVLRGASQLTEEQAPRIERVGHDIERRRLLFGEPDRSIGLVLELVELALVKRDLSRMHVYLSALRR
ncbi:MAG: hypothetical protein IPG25_10775 [Proteobacteria bacterium]|nr:hypothetical protein [Pseudomonadota bacterium]